MAQLEGAIQLEFSGVPRPSLSESSSSMGQSCSSTQPPVWGYERVMIYGSMISEYMVPDTFTNDPIEAWIFCA